VDPNGVQTPFVPLTATLGTNYLVGLTIDSTGLFGGDMFVSNLDNNIYRVTSSGSVSVFASGFNFGAGNTSTGHIAFGPDGTMFVTEGATGTVWHITPEPATLALLTAGGLALLRRRRR
jgi:glucose/arabinose dehydrogenase